MTRVSEIAIRDCVAELCAASRRPVDPSALETMLGWMRPQFEKILDRIDGSKRWAEHSDRLRETSRHLGALADFFASHADVAIVDTEALTSAVKMVRADCTLRAERTPMAFQYCPRAPIDTSAAEAFLRTIAPEPELVARVG